MSVRVQVIATEKAINSFLLFFGPETLTARDRGKFKFRVDCWDNSATHTADMVKLNIYDPYGVTFHKSGYDKSSSVVCENVVISPAQEVRTTERSRSPFSFYS